MDHAPVEFRFDLVALGPLAGEDAPRRWLRGEVHVFADVVARMWGRPKPRLNVFGACPETGVRVATHAYMTDQELRRFDRTLALFCPACRRAHQFGVADLALDAEQRVAD